MLDANQFINFMYKTYKHAWLNRPESTGAKLYECARDYLMPNGIPLLKLKAMYLLDEAANYMESGNMTKESYNELESMLIQY